jgi:DNA-binding response OmpR family regulator
MKKLLIAEDLHPRFTPVMNFLNRSDIAVHAGTSHEDLLRLHFEHHAHLIVTRPDLPGMSCESFVKTIRRSEGLRNVSIVLLHAVGAVHHERALRCGANYVMSLATPSVDLARKVQELLEIPRRRSYRVIMNMAVAGKRNDKPFMCNMENISVHGMLVRTTEVLNRGDRISCSFYLPDGSRVSADGDVVRIVQEASLSEQKRYGIQFANLTPPDELSITSFVNREVQRLKVAGQLHDGHAA